MKSLLIIFFLFVASIANQASAYVIIISGGGPNNKYDYIMVSPGRCVCRGAGNNNCPVKFFSVESYASPIYHPLGDLADYVLAQVAHGNPTGTINYQGEVPASWRSLDKESVEITIDPAIIKDTKYNDPGK